MGYSTSFFGRFEIDPPLNATEVAVLREFADTDHRGTAADRFHGLGAMPGIWCQWTPSDDGTVLAWNGMEKFYEAAEWLRFLIASLLAPSLGAPSRNRAELADFTFDHTCYGSVFAAGEAVEGDLWRIDVEDNVVNVVDYGHEFVPEDVFDDDEDWTFASDLFYHLEQRQPDEAIRALEIIVASDYVEEFAPIREFIEDLQVVATLPPRLIELAAQIR